MSTKDYYFILTSDYLDFCDRTGLPAPDVHDTCDALIAMNPYLDRAQIAKAFGKIEVA